MLLLDITIHLPFWCKGKYCPVYIVERPSQRNLDVQFNKIVYRSVFYSMYGKCQIQMVHYVRIAVLEPSLLKNENYSLSPPSTPVLHQKKV